MGNWTNAKLCDVANLVLGAVLFVSPWMFGFDAGKVSQNAMITGLGLANIAIATRTTRGITPLARSSSDPRELLAAREPHMPPTPQSPAAR